MPSSPRQPEFHGRSSMRLSYVAVNGPARSVPFSIGVGENEVVAETLPARLGSRDRYEGVNDA